MLIQMVETELEKRKSEGTYKYKGHFKGQSHFFGYVPSFDEKGYSYFESHISITSNDMIFLLKLLNLPPQQFMLVMTLCFVSGIPDVQIWREVWFSN